MLMPENVKVRQEKIAIGRKRTSDKLDSWVSRTLTPMNEARLIKDESSPGGSAIADLDRYGSDNLKSVNFESQLNMHREFAAKAYKDDSEFVEFASRFGLLWDGFVGRKFSALGRNAGTEMAIVSEPLIFWKWHAERLNFLIRLMDILVEYRTPFAAGIAQQVLSLGHEFGKPVYCEEGLALSESMTGHVLYPSFWGDLYLRERYEDRQAVLTLENYMPWVPELEGSYLFANSRWDAKKGVVETFIHGPNISGKDYSAREFMDRVIEYLASAISRSAQQFSTFTVCPYTGKVEIEPQGILGLSYALMVREFSGRKLRTQRVCDGCGAIFYPRRRDQKVCSDLRTNSSSAACRQKARRKRLNAIM